jgi:uncharacterized damage-inducible protein DinB
MNAALQKQFSELEKSRKDLFEDLRSYDDEVINRKPAPGAWSIAQVVEHLIKAEENSLIYLQKKTQDTSKIPVAGLRSQWRYFLTATVFMTNIKYKAPAIVVPSESFATIKQLDQHWAKVRKDTFELLNHLPEADLKKEIWKHAVAGKMNVTQMLAFFNMHFNRHRKQVYRTLAELVL